MRTAGDCGCSGRGTPLAGLRGDGAPSTMSNVGVRTAIGLIGATALLAGFVVLVTR